MKRGRRKKRRAGGIYNKKMERIKMRLGDRI